jgi:hypothetical protein
LNNSKYFVLILGHVLLGFLLYWFKPLSLIYCHVSILVGLLWIFRNRNFNEEALIVCAYIVGGELLIKMTKGYLFWEYAKYAVMITMLLGMYFRGISRNAIPYWVFLILLIPGVIMGIYELGSDERVRQAIIFNILGPLTLVICALYCYQRKLHLKRVMDILFVLSLPIISSLVYSILYTPDLSEFLVHTGSNFVTSGGYGPNQVATFFGLGMFVYFTRTLLASPTNFLVIFNLLLSLIFAYRALITFSRGGLITGLIIIFAFLFLVLVRSNSRVKFKITNLVVILIGGLVAIWLYSLIATGGLIEKRYKNQDALGREKESLMSGREKIMKGELALFMERPIFGGGVGVGSKYREENFDLKIASHNEVTRMLAEHGLFGIIGLIILGITPLVLYIDNKMHFFLLSFLLFWFLTLNHTAMRVAMPAFIYSLALLKVKIND